MWEKSNPHPIRSRRIADATFNYNRTEADNKAVINNVITAILTSSLEYNYRELKGKTIIELLAILRKIEKEF